MDLIEQQPEQQQPEPEDKEQELGKQDETDSDNPSEYKRCWACDEEIRIAAKKCHHCGESQDRSSAPLSGLAKQSQAVILIGGVLLMVGPFLPWIRAGILSANGIAKTGGEAYILIGFGALLVASALYSLLAKKKILVWGPIVLGVLSTGLASLFFLALIDHVSGLRINVSLEAGVFATLLGAVFSLFGSIAGFIAKVKAKKS